MCQHPDMINTKRRTIFPMSPINIIKIAAVYMLCILPFVFVLENNVLVYTCVVYTISTMQNYPKGSYLFL